MAELTLSAGAHAFGDGNHPTTRGMIAALGAIDPASFTPQSACDIGAGSGILSFAILEKFRCPVVAVDCEYSAVETILANATENAVTSQLNALQADGFDHPHITAASPFDLIVMNILAEPLMALAADAAAHLAPGGVLIISGILAWQEPQILEAYEALGLERTSRISIGDWTTLIWQKP